MDALYSVISATGLTSVLELRENWQTEFAILLENMKNTDEPTKHILQETLRSLIHMTVRNLPAQMKKEQLNHKKTAKSRKRGITNGSKQDQ